MTYKIDGNTPSSEIANIIADVEKELQKAIDNKSLVSEKVYTIGKEILERQIEKKNYSFLLSKARDVIRKKELELSTLKNQFWKARNSGL